jgi:GT2 family glycosyltransferase
LEKKWKSRSDFSKIPPAFLDERYHLSTSASPDTASPASTAAIIGVEGRRAFIFVDDGACAEGRFAFALNGEPVRATRIATHKEGFARGLNLISNGQFSEPALPWRGIGDPAPVFGRNLSPHWKLSSGDTAYLSAPANTEARLEYIQSDGEPFVPVIEGEPYTLTGYFAHHRCVASAGIDLFDADKVLVTSLHESIPKMRGGQSLTDYARVAIDFLVPPKCRYARLQLSIDQYITSTEHPEAEAYLFFTNLAFVIAGDSGVCWRPERLSADQAAALSRGASILDVTLPRFSTNGNATSQTFEVIDTRTGTPAQNSPFSLVETQDLTFTVNSFDGVTLAGRISEITERKRIELVVDGIVSNQIELNAATDGGAQNINFRIADEFLDGAPHVVEVRDGTGGKTLFINVVALKCLVTPWETAADLGRFPLPIELHPMARQRYKSLLASIAEQPSDTSPEHAAIYAKRIQQLGICHDILSRRLGADTYREVLELPTHNNPDVSVILCTSDAASIYRTIAALILAANTSQYEVIVYTDDTPDNIERARTSITGATFIASKDRVGRAQLANKGVEAAHGDYIALLEPTSEPSAHWLDELRRTFELFDQVGIAGCKLVKPNGRLHEAGGILWSSGNRQPVGANGNAEHPQVNYARQVDYVSSNALMVRKDVWQKIGGMSEGLLDTALEDVDLALKVRTAGHKIVYAPQAVVTIDPKVAQQSARRPLSGDFKRRWADAFREHPNESLSVRPAMDYGIKDRILFIDQKTPRPDVDAGSYAAIQEIRVFQALGYKITFLPQNLGHNDTYTTALERMGVEVIHAPFATSIEDVLKERGEEFSLVYITRYHVARTVLPFVRRFNPNAKVILNNADLHFLRELRSALALKDAEMLRRSKLTRDLELEVMRQTDLTISYNDVEHAVIQSHNLDQTRVAKAPWIVTPAATVLPFSKRTDIGFLGSFGHRPNVDAMKFFAHQVMPLLRQTLPDIRLMIYGSQIGPEIEALATDHIVIKGHVGNLADAFDYLKLFVAPLTAGAGIKGKVLSAMAFGVPTVLSPAAAEGIGAQAGTHYLNADAPSDWVAAISAAYGDEKRWNSLSRSALDFVETHHSFEKGVQTMRAALEMINIYPPHKSNALCCRVSQPPLA